MADELTNRINAAVDAHEDPHARIDDLEDENEELRRRVAALHEAIDSVGNAIATHPGDWSGDHRLSWVYGIILGWSSVTDDVAEAHGWDEATVRRLQWFRKTVEDSAQVAKEHNDVVWDAAIEAACTAASRRAGAWAGLPDVVDAISRIKRGGGE